ncbi:MAG: hypothetical protein ACYS8W_10060 [Planctomycetota bacterium]
MRPDKRPRLLEKPGRQHRGAFLILALLAALTLTCLFGCKKKSDIDPLMLIAGETGSGTGITTSTGTGTDTDSGTISSTGTGSSSSTGAGTGTGGGKPEMLECYYGAYSTGTNEEETATILDGDLTISDSPSEQGFMKLDLSGIDPSAKVKSMHFYYYVTGSEKQGKVTLHSTDLDPQVLAPNANLWQEPTNWETEFNFTDRVGQLVTYIYKEAALNAINEAIATEKGYIVLLLKNKPC